MKKSTLILISCWVVVGLIFLTFTVLPGFENTSVADNTKQVNIFIRLFYSFMLCYPYLRAVQSIMNRSKPRDSDQRTFSEYKKEGRGLEYMISQGGYLLIGIVIMWMALTSLFKSLSIFHYLSVILYGLSIVLLDLGIGEVAFQRKDTAES